MKEDIPLVQAVFAWNPTDTGARSAMVGRSPDKTGWSEPYLSTDGACLTAWADAAPDARVIGTMRIFLTMVVYDGIDPMTAHRAFLQVPEYRQIIAA